MALDSVFLEAVLLESVPYAESIFSDVLQSSGSGDAGLLVLFEELAISTWLSTAGEDTGVGSLPPLARILTGGLGGFFIVLLNDLESFKLLDLSIGFSGVISFSSI